MVKDQVLAKQIYDSIDLTIEAENELLKYAVDGDFEKFAEIAELLFTLLNRINYNSKSLIIEEDGITIDKALVSILDSLQRIIDLMVADREYALKKIEFELIPLTEECRVNFYFWAMVNGDREKEKKYLEEEVFELADNKYIRSSIETGNWKYDLSIVVVGYNKLEYTKKCISNLLKYYPRWLRTELILINHGSDDGTKEYFESINPDKQIDIKLNGGGLRCVNRIIQGKYLLSISNDVFVQYNTIKNLYECITQGDKIAYVVPSTSNVSNLQALDINYDSEEELEIILKTNNYNNSRYREQRTRLCNPICMLETEFVYRYKHGYQFISKNIQSFPDDNLSLICRRNGYKMYLVKDAYCHHCGSVTLRSEVNDDFYLKGRRDFKKRYGIDPWYKCAYSPALLSSFNIEIKSEVAILSIDGGLGANALELKEKIRYNSPETNVFLKYILTDATYYRDVLSVGDEVEVINDWLKIYSEITKYDYVIIESIHEPWNVIDNINKIIKAHNCTIIVEITNADQNLIDSCNASMIIGDDSCKWLIYKNE